MTILYVLKLSHQNFIILIGILFLRKAKIIKLLKTGVSVRNFNGNTCVHVIDNQNTLKIIYDDLINEFEALVINTTNEDEKEKIRKIVKRLKGKLCLIYNIID